MNVYSVVTSHQEVDPCFITKLVSNADVVGALVSSVESYVRIFRKDLTQERTLTSAHTLSDACFFQSSGNEIAGCARDGFVQVWDIRASAPVRSIRVDESEEITSIAIGAKDSVIATAINNDVVLTDVGTGKTLHRLEDHSNEVTALSFHPILDNFLCSAAEDGLCVIRDVEKVEEIRPFCIGEASRSFTFAGPDRSLVCFLGTSEELSTFSVSDEDFGTKVFASDHARNSPLLCDGDSGGYLVSAFYEDWMENVLTLGGSTSGQLLLFGNSSVVTVRASFASCHTAVVRSALSADAKIFTCGEDGMVVLWQCEGDAMQLQATVHRNYGRDRQSKPAQSRNTPY